MRSGDDVAALGLALGSLQLTRIRLADSGSFLDAAPAGFDVTARGRAADWERSVRRWLVGTRGGDAIGFATEEAAGVDGAAEELQAVATSAQATAAAQALGADGGGGTADAAASLQQQQQQGRAYAGSTIVAAVSSSYDAAYGVAYGVASQGAAFAIQASKVNGLSWIAQAASIAASPVVGFLPQGSKKPSGQGGSAGDLPAAAAAAGTAAGQGTGAGGDGAEQGSKGDGIAAPGQAEGAEAGAAVGGSEGAAQVRPEASQAPGSGSSVAGRAAAAVQGAAEPAAGASGLPSAAAAEGGASVPRSVGEAETIGSAGQPEGGPSTSASAAAAAAAGADAAAQQRGHWTLTRTLQGVASGVGAAVAAPASAAAHRASEALWALPGRGWRRGDGPAEDVQGFLDDLEEARAGRVTLHVASPTVHHLVLSARTHTRKREAHASPLCGSCRRCCDSARSTALFFSPATASCCIAGSPRRAVPAHRHVLRLSSGRRRPRGFLGRRCLRSAQRRAAGGGHRRRQAGCGAGAAARRAFSRRAQNRAASARETVGGAFGGVGNSAAGAGWALGRRRCSAARSACSDTRRGAGRGRGGCARGRRGRRSARGGAALL